MTTTDAHSGHANPDAPEVYGLIVEFDSPEALVHAAKKTYDAGYRKIDAYSPIPIHGLPEAIGCKKSKVAAIMFVAGILGAVGGFMLQYGTAGIMYPMNIGGRPDFSWPSFIPITFESAILAAGVIGFIGMLALNGLPRPHHPIFNAPGFERATTDRFFLCIEAEDSMYHADSTLKFLNNFEPLNVAEVPLD